MTEKRFTITQDFEEHHRQIRDNGTVVMGCFIEPQAEVIVNLLNQLNDENEQLKERIDEYTDLCADISEIREENDELKHQVNYLRDRLDDYLRFEQENWKLKQKIIELDEIKWLRENTVWEQMPTNRKTTMKTFTKEDILNEGNRIYYK